MPEVTGLELVQTLRQLGHHRVRIGLVTAETHPERLAEAHYNGVSFVLNKPFDDAALVGAVQAAFKEVPAPAAAPRLVLGTSPVKVIEQNGPISVDALQRLVGVAAKSMPHTVEAPSPCISRSSRPSCCAASSCSPTRAPRCWCWSISTPCA